MAPCPGNKWSQSESFMNKSVLIAKIALATAAALLAYRFINAASGERASASLFYAAATLSAGCFLARPGYLVLRPEDIVKDSQQRRRAGTFYVAIRCVLILLILAAAFAASGR